MYFTFILFKPYCFIHQRGGEQIIRQFAGTDATESFYDLHRHSVIEKYHPRLCIGKVNDSKYDGKKNV